MQIKNLAVNQYKKALHVIFIFILFISSIATFNIVSSAGAPQISNAELQRLVDESDCPEGVKRTFTQTIQKNDFSELSADEVFSGTYYLAKDQSTGEIISISCSSAKKIQAVIIRIFVIIIMLVGLVLAFSIGKAAVMMITAFDDQEKFQTAVKSLTTSIAAVVGVFFSYIVIVFVVVGLLGVGRNSSRPEWNIFCQNRIVFTLTFTSGEDPCSKPV
jgi:hypothetical protein